MKQSVQQPKKQSKKTSKGRKQSGPLIHIPPELQKFIYARVKRYMDILGMNHYRFSILYASAQAPKEEMEHREGDVAASAHVDTRYLSVHIKIFPFLIEEWKHKHMNNNDVDEVIAHEVSHIATQQLYELNIAPYKNEGETKDAWESLTTVIGRLLQKIDKLQKTSKD